jgi:predicted transcriptional regulator
MNDIKMLQIAKRKKESRDIVKQILDFGVTEEQKIDIMFNIALTIENNETMKEVTSTLKKFIENINKDEEVTNNNERARLII